MEKKTLKSSFRALGTDIQIQIVLNDAREKAKAQKDLQAAKEIYQEKEKIFSRFDSESEISRLNRHLKAWQTASPDICYLASQALYFHEISQGLYDPRVIEILEKIGYNSDFRGKDFSVEKQPEKFISFKKDLEQELKIKSKKIYFARRMDFSGIAKGYITDCVADHLKKQGWKSFLVDSGGDMFAAGKNAEGEKWKIAVEGVPEEKLLLEISGKGIATSGISRKKWKIGSKKFHHLVNPKNPNYYSYELRTVSVIEKNTEEADGRAKTIVLMGKEKGLKFAEKNKIAAIFLDYKGNISITSEARKYIVPEH
jgi:FAD:protein FMN transferase